MFCFRHHSCLFAFAFISIVVSSCTGDNRTGASAIRGSSDPPAPVLISAERFEDSEKNASGLPKGIQITFTRLTNPGVAGYYVYRDSLPITAPDPSLRITVGGDTLIPQPESGSSVVVLDLFENGFFIVPWTYYYRVSALDIYGNEGPMSNQMSFTTSEFNPSVPVPSEGYWGDRIAITGSNFGEYDADTDKVFFPTGNGGLAQAAIASWSAGEIQVDVPHSSVTGPITVSIAGTAAQTDQPFTVLNPFLFHAEPDHGAEGDIIHLHGGNLGELSSSNLVLFPGLTASPIQNIISWTDSEIELKVPKNTRVGQIFALIDGKATNTVPFSAHPRIDSALTSGGRPGQLFVIDGINFGSTRSGGLVTFPLLKSGENYPLWSDTRVVVEIPEGVISGQVFVKARDQFSNPLDFVVWDDLSPELTSPAPDEIVFGDFRFSVANNPDYDGVKWYIRPVGAPFLDIPYFTPSEQPFDFEGNSLALAGIRNGHYTVTARVTRVGESADVAVDVYIVTTPGDLNLDGVVDDMDIAVVDENFGLTSGREGYSPLRDADLNGVIDETDVSTIGYHFGETSP
ncbi:MAG: hypothetical protein HRF49_09465 [bacterium]|jgi:hypothetical protein